MDDALMLLTQTRSGEMRLATVVGIAEHSIPLVTINADSEPVRCAVLRTSDTTGLTLSPGDLVMVLYDARLNVAVVLGRVDAYPDEPLGIEDVPDELVIEARHSLTLRVGDGSITIREDGRILIKGKDLVSHAKRMNRIRGGSVEIN